MCKYATVNLINNLKPNNMTYLYYKTSTWTNNPQINEKTKAQWEHLATKSNWRITQLANGYYQTEVSHPDKTDEWADVTRRETLEGAEKAINGSVEHFAKKLESVKGPKVVKTFE